MITLHHVLAHVQCASLLSISQNVSMCNTYKKSPIQIIYKTFKNVLLMNIFMYVHAHMCYCLNVCMLVCMYVCMYVHLSANM